MPILCATNFSEPSLAAAEVAAELAKKVNTTLLLVHVGSADIDRATAGTLSSALRQSLHAEADRLAAFGARVERELLLGPIAPTLAKFAEDRKASLIVAGAPRKESFFAGAGGRLDRLAVATPVPLLMVKAAPPLLEWLRGKRPLRVLLGVGRTGTLEAARAWVTTLRGFGPIELLAGHVYYVVEACERFGLPLPDAYDALSPELESALRTEVLGLVGPQPPGTSVVPLLQPGMGRQADHLVELAVANAADLIVLGTHHRRGLSKLWSISHHTLRLAPMSVTVVPTHEGAATSAAVPRIRNVLVTTDFSEVSNRAVPHAFSLVDPGGRVYLVHVSEPGLMPQQERALADRLQELVPREAAVQGKRGITEVIQSPEVSKAILQTAERLGVDAICIASRGRSGVKRALLGSVASEVVQSTRRPLYLIHDEP